MAKTTKTPDDLGPIPGPDPYKVGPGKPPLATRFQPGQSGNPKGRPKGSLNQRAVLETILAAEIEVTENGRARRTTLLEALMKRQAMEGLKGNLKAIENMLDRHERLGRTPELAEESDALDEEDDAILARALARIAQEASPPVQRSKRRRDGEDAP